MRVAVTGAGIAGLTVAAALTRARVPCAVFEQAPELGEVGAGIQLAPNAARLLHRLGLGPYLGRAAVRPVALEMRRWDDGRVLRRTELRDCAARFGAPYYAVHRAVLHRGLSDLLPAGTVRLGHRCTAVAERPDGVELRFADGSAHRAGVAVGADGIHSVFRASLAGDRPRFSGQYIYRGLVSVPLAEPTVTLWLGPGQHLVRYPIGPDGLVSFAATVPAATAAPESWTAEGSVPELLRAYEGWHDDARGVLAAAGRVGRWALHDRDTLGRWGTGRTTLVGDAAHPMLPFLAQGANQAVEDAVVLANLLAAEGAAGLGRYEDVRRGRTEEVHRISRRNAAMLHLPDGAEQRRRDEVLRDTEDLRHQAWLYGHDAEREPGLPRIA
jgi:salicylate hydroxylase